MFWPKNSLFKFRLAHRGLNLSLFVAALGVTLAPPLLGMTSLAYAADTVRLEVGKPLQEAQRLASAGKNKEALAKLHEADSTGGKTPFETYQVEYVRAAAAARAGGNASAIKAFGYVINSGRLPAAQVPNFTRGLATL